MILSGTSGFSGTEHRSAAELNGKILELRQAEEIEQFWVAERRAQRTSLLQSELAEKLFVWLWSSAKPFHTAETPKRTHIHPERVRITGSQDRLCSQRCWPCLLEGGGTQITYYFSVHYLQLQSKRLDTEPLCICLSAPSPNPLTAPAPPVSLLSTVVSGLPLLLKNTIVSLVLALFSAVSLWFCFCEKRVLACEDVCHLRENVPFIFSRLILPDQTSSVKSPRHVRTPSCSRSVFIGPVRQLQWKHDCSSCPPFVDGWLVINGLGCW